MEEEVGNIPEEVTPEPIKRPWGVRRILGLFLKIVGGVLGLVLVLVALVFLVMANLHVDTIREPVLEMVHEDMSMELDYETLSIQPFSGVRIENLRIANPGDFAAIAPDFLSLGILDIGWEFTSLLEGGIRIHTFEIGDLHVALVADNEGNSSITRILEGLGPSEEKEEEEEEEEKSPTPLSHALELKDVPLVDLQSFSFHGIEFDQFELVDGKISKHTRLTDLGMSASVQAGQGDLSLQFELGSPDGSEGTRFTLVEHPGTEKEAKKEAIVHLKNTLSTPKEKGISLGMDVRLIRQNFMPELPFTGSVVGTRIHLTFDPDNNRTRFHLEGLDLIKGASTTQLDVELKDRLDGLIDPHVTRLAGQISADLALAAIPIPLEGIDFKGAVADYEINNLAVDLDTQKVSDGDIRFTVNIDEAAVAQPSQTAEMADGIFEFKVNFKGPMHFDTSTKLHVNRMDVTETNTKVNASMKGFKLDLVGTDFHVDPTNPMGTKGALDFKIHADTLKALAPEAQASMEDFGVSMVTQLTGEAPYHAQLAVPIGRVVVNDPQGIPMVTLEDFKVTVDAQDVMPDFSQPAKAALGFAFTGLDLSKDGIEASVRDVNMKTTALVKSTESFDVDLHFPVGSVQAKTPDGVKVSLESILVTLGVDGFVLNNAQPHESRGEITFATALRGLDLNIPGTAVDAGLLGLNLDVSLDGSNPMQVHTRIPMEDFKVGMKGRSVIRAEEGHVDVQVQDLALDMEQPDASDAHVIFDVDLNPITMKMDVTKTGEDVDVALALNVRHLGPVSATLPRDLRKELKVPWNKVGVRLDTKARVEGFRDLNSMRISHTSKLALRGFSVETPAASFSSPKMTWDLRTSGTMASHKVDLDMALADIALNGVDYGEPLTLALNAKANKYAPSVKADVVLRAPRAMELDLGGELNFNRGKKQLSYGANFRLANLSFVESQAPPEMVKELGLNWHDLMLELNTKGSFKGLVKRFNQNGPVLESDPLSDLTGSHETRVQVRNIAMNGEKGTVQMPAYDLAMDVTANKGAIDMKTSMGLPSFFAQMPGMMEPYEIEGFTMDLGVESDGPPKDGEVRLTLDKRIVRLKHNRVEGYDVGNFHMGLDATINRLEKLEVKEFVFKNEEGGTELTFHAIADGLNLKAADPTAEVLGIPGRQSFSMKGSLTQDLDPVKVNAESMTTSGKIHLPFEVSSGDMEIFRLLAKLEADQVNVDLPDAGIHLKNFSGKVPILEDILVPKEGGAVEILPGPGKNLYSRKRFEDIHPFLDGDNYIAVQSLEMMGQTMAPIAGNIRVSRDVFAMDQLKIGFRGGNIFGQFIVDYEGGSPKLLFKGNVTGIRPSESKDVLDANATLMLAMEPLSLDGRIQVVRIGQQHLLDMLDVVDPYQENVNMNRARMGLQVGYPEFLRLKMKDGFLAIKLKLGGAASAFRLDEIKGIALGPFLNTYVAPALSE